MQYIRFMGQQEFQAFLQGKTLANETNWKNTKFGSNSIGFCFFPYGNGYDKAEKILSYIAGVSDISVAAVFEPIAPIFMKKSFGRYRDPDFTVPENFSQLSLIKTISKEEYCIKQYSNKTFRLVAFGYPYLAKKQWKVDWICK